MIFIPKPGNRPSELPKSYRPISPTSFVLKTMERLIDVHIRGRLDLSTPLHSSQFAYKKGKSTEGALHYLVRKIERTLGSKEIALCAFLDIEGAFDNTGYSSIERAISSRGIEDSTSKWMKAMLRRS